MAERTRISTVEITRICKDEHGMLKPEDYKELLEEILKRDLDCYDHIQVTKVQDFVFPDQPKPKLTKRERAFCELIGFGYIARDKDTDLWWHEYKPKRDEDSKGAWYAFTGSYIELELFDEIPFMFITWEDDEPWSVEDLLELEVEE